MAELTEEQQEFVTFIHQIYATTGELLTEELATTEFGFTSKQFRSLMADEAVHEALEERGIHLKRFHVDPGTWQSKALSPVQLLVANSLLDLTDTRSDKKKLQDFGVSTTKYESWKRDPVFAEYIRTRAESMLNENFHEADRALLDKVKQGDIRAIAYFNEFRQRFTPQRGSGPSDNNAVANLQSIIVRIVEIVTDEVDDLAVAARIGDRLQTLMSAHQLANSVAVEQLPEPEVAKPRELTPKMKELMDHGQGVNL